MVDAASIPPDVNGIVESSLFSSRALLVRSNSMSAYSALNRSTPTKRREALIRHASVRCVLATGAYCCYSRRERRTALVGKI
jgi:hypothetical protein